MEPQQVIQSVLAELRRTDSATVGQLLDCLEVRVLRTLTQRFRGVPGSVDVEGAAASAGRTLLRRMRDGDDPRLESLETLEQLTAWLSVAACNRVRAQIRRAGVESRHGSEIATRADAGEPDWLVSLFADTGTDSTDQLIARLFERLDERERQVLAWHYLTDPPLNTDAIGHELGISSRQVRKIRERICEKALALSDDAG